MNDNIEHAECCFCREAFTDQADFLAHMLSHSKDPRPKTVIEQEAEARDLNPWWKRALRPTRGGV